LIRAHVSACGVSKAFIRDGAAISSGEIFLRITLLKLRVAARADCAHSIPVSFTPWQQSRLHSLAREGDQAFADDAPHFHVVPCPFASTEREQWLKKNVFIR
jgi:photosystem II stability/assembly factor-like uncharacterized protein